MAKKDPVRGMEPMSEYTRVTGSDLEPSKMSKALDVAGSGMVIAGLGSVPIYAAKRMGDAKKKLAAQEDRQKSGIALDAENIKKDQQLKKEYEAYEKSKGMKKGGTASSRADGIAQRGKTRGKII